MARPFVLSFDCAGTLLHTEYTPEGFAMRAARQAGLDPEPGAEPRYASLFRQRLSRYVELNRAGDASALREFWLELLRRWTADTPMEGHEASIFRASEELLYSPEHRYFTLFDDVLPALKNLSAQGWRMIVLSNWDVTLERVLRNADLYRFFHRIFASLSFGIEKPDPRFFQFAEREMGLGPEDFVHIGDRLDDDLEGAQKAGWRGLLLDRTLKASTGNRLARLTDLPQVLQSIA